MLPAAHEFLLEDRPLEFLVLQHGRKVFGILLRVLPVEPGLFGSLPRLLRLLLEFLDPAQQQHAPVGIGRKRSLIGSGRFRLLGTSRRLLLAGLFEAAFLGRSSARCSLAACTASSACC